MERFETLPPGIVDQVDSLPGELSWFVVFVPPQYCRILIGSRLWGCGVEAEGVGRLDRASAMHNTLASNIEDRISGEVSFLKLNLFTL